MPLKGHTFMLKQRTLERHATRGMSVIEVMVGIAIGLVLISGVLSLFVTNLINARRMLVEARVNQDMRAAADLIVRDLRRASYWQNAINGTIVVGTAAAPVRNPYQAIAPDAANSAITYSLSRDAPTENDAIDTNEQFGFRLNANTIQMQTANGTWQTVTDPSVLTVNQLALTVTETAVPAGNACPVVCSGAGCPSLTLRNYQLVLQGQSATDATVVRRLVTRARVRNDFLTGACPAT